MVQYGAFSVKLPNIECTAPCWLGSEIVGPASAVLQWYDTTCGTEKGKLRKSQCEP
jgi:hypothetical protein